MNIGQLIGELRMKCEAESTAIAVPAPRVPVGFGEKEAAILSLFKDQKRITTVDVRARLGLTQSDAGVVLLRMMDKGAIRRPEGGQQPYEYVLP